MPLIQNTNRAIYELVNKAACAPDEEIDFVFGDFDQIVLKAKKEEDGQVTLLIKAEAIAELDRSELVAHLQTIYRTKVSFPTTKNSDTLILSFLPSEEAARELASLRRNIFSLPFYKAFLSRKSEVLRFGKNETIGVEAADDRIVCTICFAVPEANAVLMKLFLNELVDCPRQGGWTVTTFTERCGENAEKTFIVTLVLFSRCYESEAQKTSLVNAILDFRANARYHVHRLKTLMNVKMRAATNKFIIACTGDPDAPFQE